MLGVIPYNKKLLPAIAHYIFIKIFQQIKHKGIIIIFDDLADTTLVKLSFLEWKKILSSFQEYSWIKKIKVFCLFMQQNKMIDFDSIIELFQLTTKIENISPDEKICVLLQQSILQEKILSKPIEENIYKGMNLNFENFITTMTKFGYTRKEYVESIGEFAVRGNIIDIWANGFLVSKETLHQENKKLRTPARIVLDDNVVVHIKQFDITTQRSFPHQEFEKIEIYPVNFEYFDKILSQAYTQDELLLQVKELFSNNFFQTINCSEQQIPGNDIVDIQCCPTVRYFANIDIFNKDIQRFITEGYRIIIGYNYDSELNKLKTSLPACVIDRVFFVRTSLPFGFYTKEDKIFFTTFNDIFSKYELFTYPRQKIYTGIRLENIWEIQSEDYVVHKEYGIAKFIGIKKISVHGNNKEFLTLLFRDNVCLYIPLTQIDMVEKYISITGKPPSLSPLNREIWNRTTKRVKEKIKEFISQLYTLYTKRKQLKGIKFTRDLELEKMFAETFEYEETEDQKKAIGSVLEDMASDYPMDRIIVGDVGFGKTEIALRAAFTAVYNGRQVAVLCPTTVLAEQHYRIFISRFERFGFNVGILTRLQSKKYIEETINKISEGIVDIVIGTHILLTDKIKFANLGLVIIDEEHKFGVRQKEKIRLRFKPKADVSLTNFTDGECFPDVLSLTATPIPRTLAFGLEGIKDISVIETPPEGRLPVETFLLPYDEQVVVDVINRELHRGGQIYYVFNDINLIEHKTNKIKNFFPDVVVEFVHSKLPAKKIEEVMTKFVKEEIQILVSTTIIESGLDIPNVNTIIIEKIENFGLAQLYQLRGRVGRRDKKAYCYLFYSNQDMTINARKRISALLEFTSLGSGYRLALRDLEIRGAGEILGTKQHGFINEIGLSMYSKIIHQLVNECSGRKDYEIDPKIDIDIDAYLPEAYISDCETRISFYRKILQAKSMSEINNVKEELYDRFGKPSSDYVYFINNLFLLAHLRVLLRKYKIANFCQEKYEEAPKNNSFLKFFVTGNDSYFLSLMRKKIQSCKNLLIQDVNKNIIIISAQFDNILKFIEKLLELL